MFQKQRISLLAVVILATFGSGAIPLSTAFLGHNPSTATPARTRSDQAIIPRKETFVNRFAENNKSNNRDIANAKKTDETLQTLQIFLEKVSALSQQLQIMESKLRDNRREWMKEKIILTRKIALLTELLQEQNKNVRESNSQSEAAASAQDDTPTTNINNEEENRLRLESLERDLQASYDREEDIVYEQERLEREVHILQTEIVRVQNLYRTEQNKIQELTEELEDYQQRDGSWSNLVDDQERQIEELQAKVELMEQEKQIQQQGVSVDPVATNGNSMQPQQHNGTALSGGN